MIELSVIIPTHNRAKMLRACLEALSHQSQSVEDFEVIVVDDGSTDETAKMLAQFKTPFSLRVIREAKQGQCAARNRGLENAARYCLFLDDDVIADRDLVAEHLKAQRVQGGPQGGVVAIGQLTMPTPPSTDWYARHFARRWRAHYEHLNQQTRTVSWQDCYSGNFSVPRQAIVTVGGFATDLPTSFDVELGYRLQQNGLSLVYLPKARGEHRDDKPGRRLLSDDVRAGQMLPELLRRHPELSPGMLDAFWDTSPRAVLLRRLLLGLNIAPSLLVRLGSLVPTTRLNREWFKFVNAYAYWSGVREAARERHEWGRMMQRTPILMYHAFGRSDEPASRFILPIRRFEQQMAWLKRLGYCAISLEELLRYRREARLLPARSVVITIDDGYLDNYTLAYPILRRYGFTATVFLVSDLIGAANRWDKSGALVGRPLMSWTQIHEMHRGGITFGAHTRTHVDLAQAAPDLARQEIEESRVALERELGTPVKVFAYPFGLYNDAARLIVQEDGFEGACSTRPGLNTLATSNFELHRCEVRGTDSLLHFTRCLLLGSDHVKRRK